MMAVERGPMAKWLPMFLAALGMVLVGPGCPTYDWGDDDGGDDDVGDDDGEEPCSPQGESGTVPVDDECLLVMPYEEFDPVELIEWQWTGSAVDPTYNQVIMTPVVINLTDDNGDTVVDALDTPDVVFSSHAGSSYSSDGHLRAINGSDGSDIWTITDPAYATRPTSGLAAGDVDGDGLPEIVGITDDGEVMLVEHDGTPTWVTSGGYGFTRSYPAIHDLYGDGDPEIIVGRLILDSGGNLVAEGAHGSGGATSGRYISFAADVDGDGVQELVADNAVYEPDGTALWANPGGPTGFPAIADFDLDGDPEVIVAGNGVVYLLDALDGSVIWGPTDLVNGGVGGPPTIADYDGDGYPEVGVAGLGAYTVLDTDGSLLWWNPTEDDSSSQTGSSVFDFNGDGVAEVVYADEHVLYVYEGPTGTVLFTAEGHASATASENPVIVDLDHDFSAEIILASNDFNWSGWAGITVLGAQEQSWYPARGIWNQHAYSITNIEDDGSVPAQPEPSWVEYNSFRHNTVSDPSVLWAPNLYPLAAELCTDACPDELVLLVEVANGGLADVNPGLGTSVWALPLQGGAQLLTTVYLEESLPGGTSSAQIAISLDPADVQGGDIRVAVDVLQGLPEGLHDECHEGDNTLVIPGAGCP